MSRPSSFTTPGGASSRSDSSHSVSRGPSIGSMRSRMSANATARYIAPVSRNSKPRRRAGASRRAGVNRRARLRRRRAIGPVAKVGQFLFEPGVLVLHRGDVGHQPVDGYHRVGQLRLLGRLTALNALENGANGLEIV